MPRKAKLKTTMVDLVQLINEDDLIELVGEANASLLYNPTVMWAKFILTDDMPNGNGTRIPVSEFDNLMESGIHMPVKMSVGSIEAHDGATPLGVITHLMKEDNKVIALAALWERERPSDTNLIRTKFNNHESVNISWEVLYADYAIAEDGVTDLHGVALRAATIVANPAYEGRTPVLAVAAKKWSKAYIEKLPNSSFMYVQESRPGSNEMIRLFPIKDGDGKINKDRVRASISEMADCGLPATVTKELRNRAKRLLEMLEENASMEEIAAELGEVTPSHPSTQTEENTLDELKQLQDTLANTQVDLKKANDDLALKTSELADQTAKLTALEAELKELREFKASIEEEAEKIQRLDAIKQKFTEASIEKDDEYFTENSEFLLSLTDSGLEFMLQELKSFSKNTADEASLKTKIPNLTQTPVEVDMKSLAQALRERNTK